MLKEKPDIIFMDEFKFNEINVEVKIFYIINQFYIILYVTLR